MTKVTIEGMDDLLKNLGALQKKIETGAVDGVNDSVTLLASDIKENYVSGPPGPLKVVTENLRSEIKEHSATVNGDMVSGAVSSTAENNGFHYDEYHEVVSGRAFMMPSFVKNTDKIQDKIAEKIQKAL